MKNIRKEISIWVQVVVFLAIWTAILLITRTDLRIGIEAIKKLPDVITVYTILLLLFTKWAWKWPVFKGWLVPFPNLQGTWKGTLESTWINPETNAKIPPKEVLLVIRQSFNSISCTMHTDESTSHSTTAQINEEDAGGTFTLSYNYINRPNASVKHRSAMHDGAVILEIIPSPIKKLKGEYWTNRKSTGDISVTFHSSKLDQHWN